MKQMLMLSTMALAVGMILPQGSAQADPSAAYNLTPQKVIAILDATQSTWSNTRRCVNFYDVTDYDGNGAPDMGFNQSPMFSVWTGYENAAQQNFEDPGAITVNPNNGTVYISAFDSGTAGNVDVAANDTDGDYDLYRINYSAVLNDWQSRGAPMGAMYAPLAGPDGTPNPQHPDAGVTFNIAGAGEKIGEMARTQDTPLGQTPYFDYDMEFVDPGYIAFLDNQVGPDGTQDNPTYDHDIRGWQRVNPAPGAAAYVPRDLDGDTVDEGGDGGFNLGTVESWESYQLGKVTMDYDTQGNPVGRSEPVDIAYARDMQTQGGQPAEGVWIMESDGGGDDFSFFKINNRTGSTGNSTATVDTGTGATYPKADYSLIDGLGSSRAIDQDPENNPSDNTGHGDWLRVDTNNDTDAAHIGDVPGDLLIGESGYYDLPQHEPKAFRYKIADYDTGANPLAGDITTDPTNGGAWDDMAFDIEDAAANQMHLFSPVLDDDTAVTDGRFVAFDKGTNQLYVFDIDSGAAPSVTADAYVVDLDDAGGGAVLAAVNDYEELDAVNHFLERHGIRFMLRGDMNNDSRGDGFVDDEDIDALWQINAGGSASALDQEWFDLTGDLALNMNTNSAGSDIDELVKGILGTEYGDADLDGKVNVNDLGVLATNYGLSGKGWADADFNGDGIVNVNDLGMLATTYGFSASGFASVPEPGCMAMLLGAGLGLLFYRRR